MGCCGTCVEGLLRFVLFIFNLGLLGAGLALLIVGGIAAKEFQDFADANLFESRYLWGPVALAIVVGVLLVMVGFFGIGGLCCKNKCMLKTFIIFLVLLMVLEITMMVLAFVYRDQGETSARDGIRTAMVKAYGPQSDSKTMKALDKLQQEFECCGSNSSTDYINANLFIPAACCKDQPAVCTYPYQKGCSNAMFEKFQKYTVGIFTVAIIFVILQVIGLILAIKFIREDSGAEK
ncbi:CD151 antigen-like [Sycon ciliatum]|uniref:CD151 antigen-like n=1 Tax=Sycon ciliatum TaxID=27933 RepID=UPI0020A848D7|eukprot:scpid93075/ scgid9159/ CD63 antigen